ncbi:hypothetical protein GCM10009551_073610 [Nocardiopsis tropica]
MLGAVGIVGRVTSELQRMLGGELYRDGDPELVAMRKACGRLLDRFNATSADDDAERGQILHELLGGIGEGSWIMPRFQCDYGTNITIGANSFLNYDAILMDCAPITIGDDVSIGPRTQLLTALPPIDDHAARRPRWGAARADRDRRQRVVRRGSDRVPRRAHRPQYGGRGGQCGDP